MAKLVLDKITCVKAQEGGTFSDGDEVYFTFKDLGGTTGPVTSKTYEGMDTGDERKIHEEFNFSGSMKVSLVEDDGIGTIADDLIQTHTISGDPNSPLTFPLTFSSKSEGATYTVDYHLVV